MTNTVLFDATPKQQELIEAAFSPDYLYIMFGGAIRGGKTAGGIGTLLLYAKLFPLTRWAIVRDTLQTLKRNTIPSFFKFCPQSFIANYTQDTQTVTFKNGSQILFFSENYEDDKELNRWKGLEVNGFLFEEANELQEISFYKGIERAGTHIPPSGYKKPKPLIILTCNPAQNWVKDLFYNRWKENNLPKNWLYIPSKITDNPYIMADKDFVESLKNLPRYQYEVFVNGDWDIQLKTGGEFYKCFELDKHVVEETIYNPNLPLHISWDDNVNPYLPLGIFQLHKRDTGGYDIHMIDEIAGKDPLNTIRGVCNEFKRKYPNHMGGLIVYGDATARKEDTKLEKGHDFYRIVTDNLKEYKPSLRVLSNNPSVKMRGDFINTVLEKELFDLRIFINKNCKFAINDFVGTKEAADGTKNKEMETDPKTKVRYQKYGHFTDLFDYFFVSAFAAEFMKYQKGGLDLVIRMGRAKNANTY